MQDIYLQALAGGILIGLSATLLLALNGRIAGISGIFNGIFASARDEVSWRLCFIIGLPVGAFLQGLIADASYYQLDEFSPWLMLAAGLLVGFGTKIGGGCTSGHGVCGLGRLSLRSLVATLSFMASAIITLYIFRHLLGIG